MPLLINNLSIERGGREILNGVTFQLDQGQLLAVLGANGAGKSSLLRAIAGELSYKQGSIRFNDLNLLDLNSSQQARLRAVMLQESELTFPFAVHEVVEMGGYPFEEATAGQTQAWVDEALELADIAHLQSRPYEQLSGGEQRRVQFARVLVQCLAMHTCSGKVYLMLDEPLANMDPKYQLQLMEVLRKLAHQRQFGILIIMHDVNLATLCDRILLLSDRSVIAYGDPASVLNRQNLRRVYDLDMEVLAHPLEPARLIVVTI